MPLTALNFFAGSGLVEVGLRPEFTTVWANDICPRKAAVFTANHPRIPFQLEDIRNIRGRDLPSADLAWASFPCQDLSLAGNLRGIEEGTRSGLFWQWLRVLDEVKRRPRILVAENVVGFLTAGQGRHFHAAYSALRKRGYRAGALVIDARLFLPQSRPRAFLIAIAEDMDLRRFSLQHPADPFHPVAVQRSAPGDSSWVWWNLPQPARAIPAFEKLCELDAVCDPAPRTRRLCALLSPLHRARLSALTRQGGRLVGTGYRRTRRGIDGEPVQRLEIRFDGIAGCLRTPEGGSSRQVVLIVENGRVRSRLMTAREYARLMGAADSYKLPVSSTDAYRAMGDAVAVPVTRWLSQKLLAPLITKH